MAEEGVPFRGIAGAIGQQLGVPTASIDAGDAGEHFSFLAFVVGSDIPASSSATRALLGWEPEQPGLTEDREQGHYFVKSTT